MTKLIFILIAAVSAETIVLFILWKINRRISQENEDLQEAVKKLKKNLSVIVQHAEELADIKRHEAKTVTQIQEAKSDDEVADIIDTIISANNNRVRNNSSD